MKCLVVDDSATMRRIVLNALKSIGMTNVLEAGDGNEALQVCDGSVELVITDWNMPNMGGLELTRSLRSNPTTAKTPILMVTTRSVQEDILQAVEAGVNGYILKPFTPQVLKEKISQITAVA
ncbi:MAG: response regulator [Gemmatimonadales bacterium]|nr:response regulator [Gemmatimonadales bacterium]MDX2060181.1 response regulator [Gemmatimonadales bacterium]